MNGSRSVVVDASVAILLFVDEPQSPHAWQLFWRLTEPEPLLLFAPDLIYAECANILWKYSRGFGYSPRQAMENLQDLAKLHIESVPTRDLYRKAYGLALKQGVTVYERATSCWHKY